MSLNLAMYTALTGLRAHQYSLDTIGHNLSNINTTAYKREDYRFADLFAHALSNGKSKETGRGPVAPALVGLGTATASIDRVFEQGPLEKTGNTLDFAIEGIGFFVLKKGDQTYLTREGSFYLQGESLGPDKTGKIIPQTLYGNDGLKVQGFKAEKGVIGTTLGDIQIPMGQVQSGQRTSKVYLRGNLDTTKEPSEYRGEITTQISLQGNLTDPTFEWKYLFYDEKVEDGIFKIVPRETKIIFTKKDRLLETPTAKYQVWDWVADDIPFLKAGDPDAKPSQGTVLFYAEDDQIHGQYAAGQYAGSSQSISNIRYDFSKLISLPSMPTAIHEWQRNGYAAGSIPFSVEVYDTITTFASFYDPEKKIYTFTPKSVIEKRPILMEMTRLEQDNAGTTWGWKIPKVSTSGFDTGKVHFDTNGQWTYSGTSQDDTVDSPASVKYYFGEAVFDKDGKWVKDIPYLTQIASFSNLSIKEQDGYRDGTLDRIEVDQFGIISGVYSNGNYEVLAQIALGNVPNPLGLVSIGGNLFQKGIASGEIFVGKSGDTNDDKGFGRFLSGMLEGSNVNLGLETGRMITTQRGFQANARVVSTADEMLQELVRLKR